LLTQFVIEILAELVLLRYLAARERGVDDLGERHVFRQSPPAGLLFFHRPGHVVRREPHDAQMEVDVPMSTTADVFLFDNELPILVTDAGVQQGLNLCAVPEILFSWWGLLD
jgi:hypothetical protein